VRISQNGELLPETKRVIAVIAKRNLVLATGHPTAEEALMLVREGRTQGVKAHGCNPCHDVALSTCRMHRCWKLRR